MNVELRIYLAIDRFKIKDVRPITTNYSLRTTNQKLLTKNL